MADQAAQLYDDARMVGVGVRLLTPDNTLIFEGTFSLMHCAVKDDTLYRGVFAVMMFPITHPDRYISLRYTDKKDKEQEIGIIADLTGFPEPARLLVQANLIKHYYEQIITRVYDVENKFGLLFFDVETQLGGKQFIMPWRGDRAEDYGANGKVLLDAFDNRYLIPDLSKLPPADRNAFTSFIYW
jgi:ATP-binding cassette, subfamily B, bacterial